MSTSRVTDDPNTKPVVTGYPYPYPHPHPHPHPPAQVNYNHQQPQFSTAYPYAAAPAYPIQPHNDPRRGNTVFRRIIIVMGSIFILLGALTLLTYLIFKPKVPQFSIQSASLTAFNASSDNQFTANFNLTFFVRNPNKKLSIGYVKLDGIVYYKREFITETGIAPFVQETGNETTVNARFAAVSTYVGRLGTQLAGERSKGKVDFSFKVLALVKYWSGAYRARLHELRVYCDDVSFGFVGNSGSGSMTGVPKKCKVDL